MPTMIVCTREAPRRKTGTEILAPGRAPPLTRYNAAMSANPLVEVRDLARELGRLDWIVIDCRFTLTDPKAGRAAYDRGHIPGARYAHLDDDLSRPPRPDE